MRRIGMNRTGHAGCGVCAKKLMMLALALVLMLLGAGSVQAAGILPNSASDSGGVNDAQEYTWNHNVVAGEDRLLIVGVMCTYGNPKHRADVQWVTFNGVSMTQAAEYDQGGSTNYARAEVWYLFNPPVGNLQVRVHHGGSSYRACAYGRSYNGVSATPPAVNQSGGGDGVTSASLTVASSFPYSLLVDAICVRDNSTPNPVTASPLQERIYLRNNDNRTLAAGGEMEGCWIGNHAIAWSWTTGRRYAQAAAMFQPARYAITRVNTNGSITFSGGDDTVDDGGNTKVLWDGSIRFTVAPNTGYYLTGVTASTGALSGPIGGVYTVTNIKSPVTLTATFAPVTYAITTAVSGGSGGSCTATPNPVNHGSTASITCTPPAGWHLDHYTDSVDGDKAANYTTSVVTAARSVTAYFAINTYAVTFTLDGKGVHTGGGALTQVIPHGSGAVEPLVSGLDGWIFAGWNKPFDNITAATIVTAQYTKTTPTVTTWPIAREITYGQQLGAAATPSWFAEGEASVAGVFTLDDPTAVLNAGGHSAAVTFTPSVPGYNTVPGTVTLTVNKATAGISITDLAHVYNGGDKQANVTTTPPGLSKAVTYNSSAVLPVNAGSYTVDVVIADANYEGSAGDTLVISKAVTEVNTWPTAADITYGQTLANATLTGGAATPNDGGFAFDTPATMPNAGPAASFAVTYTPGDPDNHTTVSGTVPVAVNPAPLTAAIINNPTKTPDGNDTATLAPGNFSLSGLVAPDAFTVTQTTGAYAGNTSGEWEITVALAPTDFTPVGATDPDNYVLPTEAKGLGTISSKLTPSITAWPTASDITYGDALSDSMLSGGASPVAGHFDFTTPSETPGAGVYSASVTFYPNNTATYNTVSDNVDVNVDKATATVALADLDHVYDGAAKAASATTNPSGKTVVFTYDGLTPAPINAGSYEVIGTINDANYQGSATGTLVIDKADAYVTLGGLSHTYDGTAKAATSSTNPPGLTVDYAYTLGGLPATPINAGNYSVAGAINDANYQGGATDTLVIARASATVTLSNMIQTYDGAAKAATATTDPTGLSVAITYDGGATEPVAAGTYAVGVSITDPNYTGGATGSLLINKATPAVHSWPTAADITYGQTLAAATLAGGATTPAGGGFAFNIPGATPPAGTATHPVTYTPADAGNYNTVSSSPGNDVSVTVDPKALTVTIVGVPTKLYQAGNTDATLAAGNYDVAGLVGSDAVTVTKTTGVYNSDAIGSPPERTVTVALVAGDFEFTSGSAANYTLPVLATGPGRITDKLIPVVNWPTATPITYGDALSASTLQGGSASEGLNTVAGIFSFDAPAATPNAGTFSAGVIFTPGDTALYEVVSGNVSVTVNKATPSITTPPTAAAITYGQALSAATLSGAASVAGAFSFNTPSEAPDAGAADHAVTFTPEDTVNYNTVSLNVSVTVNKATPIITIPPTASPINLGQALSASTLLGGSATAPGGFAFTTPGFVPDTAGVYSASVTFTPDDAVNHAAVIIHVNVDVSSAGLTVLADSDATVSIPVGGATTFKVQVAGATGEVNYEWKKEAAAKAWTPARWANTSATLAISDAARDDAGNYRCFVTDDVDQAESPLFTLNVISGVPVAGLAGLAALATMLGLGGASGLRRRK